MLRRVHGGALLSSRRVVLPPLFKLEDDMAIDTFTTEPSPVLRGDIQAHSTVIFTGDLVNDEQFERVTERLSRVQKTRRGIKKFFAEQRKPINEARKVNLDAEKEWLAKLQPTEALLQRQIADYTKVRDAKIQEESRLALAVAKETGSLPETPMVVPVMDTSVSVRKSYSAAINPEDFMTLVKAVADGKMPVDALAPDWGWINKQARDLGEMFEAQYGHAGLRLQVKETVVTR